MPTTSRPPRGVALRGSTGWQLATGPTTRGAAAGTSPPRRPPDTERSPAVPAGALLLVGLGTPADRTLAVVGDVGWRAFTDGTVRPHERTDPDRVATLARGLAAGEHPAAPVTLTHAPSPAVTSLLDELTRADPDLPHVDGDLAVWVVTDPEAVTALTAAIAATGPATVADGHHRAAAVARHATEHDLPDGHPAAQVLTAVLAADRIHVAAFHRRVPLDAVPAELRAVASRGDTSALATALTVPGLTRATPTDDATGPSPGTWIVTVGDHRVAVTAAQRRDAELDPALAHPLEPGLAHPLDVDLVAAWLARLRIEDEAVVPVPPSAADRLDDPTALTVHLAPPRWEQVTARAAAGRTLPPKATYLTPKVPPGLIVAPRDGRTSAAGPTTSTDT